MSILFYVGVAGEIWEIRDNVSMVFFMYLVKQENHKIERRLTITEIIFIMDVNNMNKFFSKLHTNYKLMVEYDFSKIIESNIHTVRSKQNSFYFIHFLS